MLIYDTYINYYWHKFNFTKERYGIKELLDYLFKKNIKNKENPVNKILNSGFMSL